MTFRVLATGGRNFTNVDQVRSVLTELAGQHPTAILVHGDARGLDRLAASIALDIGWQVEPHPADWQRNGRGAGPIRNQEMVDSGADLCLVFSGGNGTADCRRRAVKAGIPVLDVKP